MRCSLVLAVSVSLATALPTNATAQGFLGDLARSVQTVLQRTSPVTSPLPPAQTPARKAVSEVNFASVLVGQAPSPVGYKFVLLATVPAAMDPAEEAKVRQSIGPLMRKITSNLQNTIDQLPEFSAKPGADTLEKQLSSYSDDIQKRMKEAFGKASADFKLTLGSLSSKYANDSSLAVALKPCVDDACALTQLTPSSAKYRFGRFYDWTNSKGLKGVNQAYVLKEDGSFAMVVAALDKGREWHDDFPKPILQAALLNAVKSARKAKKSLSYSAAELAALSKDNVAHLADVFDLPYAAASRLGSNAGVPLQGLSDELGRARLRECVRLRGAFEPEQAGKCAGYSIGQKDLANCLAGGSCMPAFGGQVNVETLLVRPGATLSALAGSSVLPRVSLGQASTVVDLANKCQGKPTEDAADCLLRETMAKNPKNAPMMNCIQGAAGKKATILAGCATAGLPDDQRRRIECFTNGSKDTKSVALCATRDALPPNAQKMIACADKLKGASTVPDAMTCLGIKTGSPEANCLLNHKDSWADAALCMGGNKIPPPVQDAVGCAQKSTELTGFGVCMLAKQGSGEAQRIAACYAEAQGVPAAVAICLASDKLTQDQRIVLECAAETNGAPHATAVCTGGKMAAKEMVNCKGKKFGEANCFGESNEIRKFFANAGVEIGPNSVAAQVINVQLQMAQFMTGPILDAANKALPDLMNFAQRAGIVPDTNHPGKMIATQVFGPIGGAVADDFCSHNPCDPRKWF